MKISQVFKHFKGRNGSQIERRRGRRRERGAKGVALQTFLATCRYPGIMKFYPGASREGRTGTRPYQKPDQDRTRI